MNKITGKVILKETSEGIPNLLVTIYDLDPGTKPEEILSISGSTTTIANLSQPNLGDRIGSVLTDDLGEFELTLEDDEFRIRNQQEKRPDYLLLVLAPEEQGKDLSSRILYVSSTMIRQNAGRIESFIVRLTEEQLKKAEIDVSSQAVKESQNIISRMDDFNLAETAIADKIQLLHKQKLKNVQKTAKVFDDKIKPKLINAISLVSGRTQLNAESAADGEVETKAAKNFVMPGQSINAATAKVIREGLDTNFNKDQALNGFIGISPDKLKQLQQLSADDAGEFFKLEENDFNQIFFKGNADDEKKKERSTILLKDDPLVKLCADKTGGLRCLDDTDGTDTINDGDRITDPDEEGENAPGPTVERAESEDIPAYIASLINTMASPEEPVVFGVANKSKRADQADIQKNIDAFQLNAGPADTASFHDFHNLQIAFEHVWEEAIDEGILDLAKDAYSEIVELHGGDSSSVKPGSIIDYVSSFVANIEYSAAELTLALQEEPPATVIQAFDITNEEWNALNKEQQGQLANVAIQSLADRLRSNIRSLLRQQGNRYIRYARSKLAARSGKFDRLHSILKELKRRLKHDYPFTVYAANRRERSINFGILVTYRQKWEPVSYQAGELAKTITLAPKEVRKFSKKTVVKRKRSEKEVNKSILSKKEESSATSRIEAEIVNKANAKSNFKMSADGSFNLAITGGKYNTSFGTDADRTSNEVKKDFREAVQKAAEEYKQERTVEVATEETFEEEFTESGEIMNPNDELPVTFLFYELQRRYRVSEQIHRLTPVILVAQEVPRPHEIDEDWIIAHDWILRRVLLDDSFLPALDYLRTRVVGDEFALDEMRKNVEQQREVVDALKEELVVTRSQLSRRRLALERAIEQRAGIIGGDDGLLEDAERLGKDILTGNLSGVTSFFGFGSDQKKEDEREAARIRQDAAREAFDRSVNEERKALARLEREVTALNEQTEAYTTLLREHLNMRNQILRLRLHIILFIFYYMQAIWSHEPDDQRFFRLHKVQVPTLNMRRSYAIRKAPVQEAALYRVPQKGVATHAFNVFTEVANNGDEFETVDLVEVADIDNPLGFKGNYMMFPLIQSNALTDYMMQPYIDTAFGDFMSLHDPDEFGNFSLEDFSKYVCCLKEEKPEDFDELKDELKKTFEKLITSPLRNNEEIVVPTGSLFIEALPGSHAILEDFKLMHRAIDVKKVQAEVREMELENIRRVARLLAGEREDPDIEKRIEIAGDRIQPTVDADEDPS